MRKQNNQSRLPAPTAHPAHRQVDGFLWRMLCHNRKKAASSAITVPVNFLSATWQRYTASVRGNQEARQKHGWVRKGKSGTQKGTQVRKSGTQKSKVRTKTDPKVSAEELISESGLSPQQSLFVAEYLINQNATAAAERAGYSDPNYGRQLLTNPNVKRAIDSQLVASVSRTGKR